MMLDHTFSFTLRYTGRGLVKSNQMVAVLVKQRFSYIRLWVLINEALKDWPFHHLSSFCKTAVAYIVFSQ